MGGMLAYSLSKAGLNMATKMFVLELGPDNIRVDTVIPGPVSNDLLRLVWTEEEIQVLVKKSPLGRLAQHQDVADLLPCQPRVTMTSWFVYKVIRDL